MTNTCSTCKYWSSSRNILNNVADCDKPDYYDDKSKPDAITFAFDVTVADDTSLNVVVLTSGNFGCLLHQPKK